MASEFELETVSAMEPLRSEWTELAARNRSIFKTWEWLSTWWDHFGLRRQLMVTVVRSNGRLVGILPMYRWQTRPLRVLRFLGHSVGDELGPICAPADRPLVARALRRVLEASRWDLLLAEQIPADEHWSTVLGGRVLSLEGNPVLRFGAGGWEGFLRERSANFREQVRRRPRKLAREHLVRYRLSRAGRTSRPSWIPCSACIRPVGRPPPRACSPTSGFTAPSPGWPPNTTGFGCGSWRSRARPPPPSTGSGSPAWNPTTRPDGTPDGTATTSASYCWPTPSGRRRRTRWPSTGCSGETSGTSTGSRPPTPGWRPSACPTAV